MSVLEAIDLQVSLYVLSADACSFMVNRPFYMQSGDALFITSFVVAVLS